VFKQDLLLSNATGDGSECVGEGSAGGAWNWARPVADGKLGGIRQSWVEVVAAVRVYEHSEGACVGVRGSGRVGALVEEGRIIVVVVAVVVRDGEVGVGRGQVRVVKNGSRR